MHTQTAIQQLNNNVTKTASITKMTFPTELKCEKFPILSNSLCPKNDLTYTLHPKERWQYVRPVQSLSDLHIWLPKKFCSANATVEHIVKIKIMCSNISELTTSTTSPTLKSLLVLSIRATLMTKLSNRKFNFIIRNFNIDPYHYVHTIKLVVVVNSYEIYSL